MTSLDSATEYLYTSNQGLGLSFNFYIDRNMIGLCVSIMAMILFQRFNIGNSLRNTIFVILHWLMSRSYRVVMELYPNYHME